MSWLVGHPWDLVHTAGKALLLYLTAVGGLRLSRRRSVAELSLFDFVAVVSLGAVIGRTATATGTAYLVGFVAIITILLAHWGITELRYRRSIARLIDHPPRTLIKDGEVRQRTLRRSGLTLDDLSTVLRERGTWRIRDVHLMIYESRGGFSLMSEKDLEAGEADLVDDIDLNGGDSGDRAGKGDSGRGPDQQGRPG